MEELKRLAMLVGWENIEKLRNTNIAVFGIGGVGGYVCEALSRSGVGHFTLVDHDTVSLSNINRQIIALHSTVGRVKVEVMKERMLDIDPNLEIKTHPLFVNEETISQFDFSQYDYVIDCIDTVSAKLQLIEECHKVGTPIICSMGTGNKLDPKGLEITVLEKTQNCPLAKIMRSECRKRGLNKVEVLYSPVSAIKPLFDDSDSGKRGPLGSSAFVPSSAGLMLASHVVRKIVRGEVK